MHLRRQGEGWLILDVEAEDDEGTDTNKQERHEDHKGPHLLVSPEGQQAFLQEGRRLVQETRRLGAIFRPAFGVAVFVLQGLAHSLMISEGTIAGSST